MNYFLGAAVSALLVFINMRPEPILARIPVMLLAIIIYTIFWVPLNNMSGGHFDYSNDRCCKEIFGWSFTPDYGDRGISQSEAARKLDPLEDKVISELVWDVFCLLHSFDWYASGDTSEEQYRHDVQRFKKKWLKTIPLERI